MPDHRRDALDAPGSPLSRTDLAGMMGLRWLHVDVFAHAPFTGNAVAVFPEAGALRAEQMLALTQELRVFEAIFLSQPASDGSVSARIFTAEEELTFAGHPVLGAAAALQYLDETGSCPDRVFTLDGRPLSVAVSGAGGTYTAEMDQGVAHVGTPLSEQDTLSLLGHLGLERHHLAPGLWPAMATTGLPYLIVPVVPEGLEQARIHGDGLEKEMARSGGKFVYVLDVQNCEGRSWDNLGQVEDIATGSAAGPAAEYLWRHTDAPNPLVVHQGRFTGRPSEIRVRKDTGSGHIFVAGQAIVLAEGRIL
ncbi:MAG: PhzF family phenazine biosynthesis protein [Pseudomonadota bacterium]